jgi:hypothetical protein
MLISQARTIMGAKYRNGRAAQILGWGTAGLMGIAALLFLALNYLSR